MKKSTKLFAGFLISGTFLFLAIASGDSKSSNSGTNNSSSSNNESSNSNSDKPKEWVEVIQLKGSGDKKSQPFSLGGGSKRLKYEFKGDPEFGMFAVYVVEKGQDVMKDGGVPEVMVTGAEDGESSLSQLGSGDYYLNVTAANGKWTVTVEEEK